MKILLLGGIVIVLLLVLGSAKQPQPPSLDHLANQVEKLDVIPQATRHELTKLIASASKGSIAINSHDRDAVARIERAMLSKPISVTRH